MEDKNFPPKPEQDENVSTTFSKTVKTLAVPASLGAGLFYGYTSVRDKFYDKLRNLGAFSEAKSLRLQKAQEIFPEWGVAKDISNELNALNNSHAADIDKRIAELGYNTMTKRFNSLHANKKVEVVINAFTAAGIALGVMLTVADHKSLFGQVQDKAKEGDSGPSK